ncbi:tRNA pseudouridine(55) synthase TruB [Croceicoccus sp. BE223]|uniref:tRNA pseudouridine(55) synthase TruB n=1 Tax=Croceicoccus sp. BE223 TaxID=2817716 RepID=UPI002861E85E|nr:tRNA pseudouridine(55) synthase TruB [Croceicoccus sp. BE223]MDR7103753.1 tRNA pseudouridine55 synthase [Croceicoccus sp. BE223]
MPHGWIILDKPLELGSTQAVAAVKRNLRQAGFGKVKVGHGGTLDPLATGVLPIAVGEATKLAGRMLDASKTYAFTLAFGTETTTLDAEGEACATSEVRPTGAQIAAILPAFTGSIEQVPPAYSAVKVDGQRAYDLARAGEAVTLATRAVTIHALDIVETTPDSVTLLANVSKGTYIRSLARDLAHALGSVGHVTMLRRVKAGPFVIETAISLDKLNELGKGAPLEDIILPLEAGLDDIPALSLSPDAAGAVRQGRKLSGLPHADGTYWGREGEKPVALMEITGGEARVLRGFNL